MLKYKITEKSIKSFEYQIPKDPELLLYDFYFLIGFLPRKDENPELQFVFNEAYSKCINNLSNHMIKALKWSLSAEVRHIFDSLTMSLEYQITIAKEDEKKYKTKIAKYIQAYKNAEENEEPEDTLLEKNFISKETIKFILAYDLISYKNMKGLSSTINLDKKLKQALSRKSIQMLNKPYERKKEGRNTTYLKNYMAILETQKKLHLTDIKLGEIFKDIYNNLEWNLSYGGKNWGNIANAFIKLLSADTLEQKSIWIDHAYDLQHNNGSVFTKVELYNKDYSTKWIAKALDWKRDVENIVDYYDKVSPSLKYVVAYIAKNYYNTTIELERQKAQKRKERNEDGYYHSGLTEDDFKIGDKVKLHKFKSDNNLKYNPGLMDIYNNTITNISYISLINGYVKTDSNKYLWPFDSLEKIENMNNNSEESEKSDDIIKLSGTTEHKSNLDKLKELGVLRVKVSNYILSTINFIKALEKKYHIRFTFSQLKEINLNQSINIYNTIADLIDLDKEDIYFLIDFENYYISFTKLKPNLFIEYFEFSRLIKPFL